MRGPVMRDPVMRGQGTLEGPSGRLSPLAVQAQMAAVRSGVTGVTPDGAQAATMNRPISARSGPLEGAAAMLAAHQALATLRRLLSQAR